MSKFVKFLLVGVVNTGLGYAVIFGCMYLLGISPVLSNVSGYLFGLMVSYSLNRNFTFKSTSRPNGEVLRFLMVFAIAYLSNLGVLLLLIQHFGFHEGVSQVIAGAVYVLASYFMNKHYVFRQSE